MMEVALGAARDAGARVELLDLRMVELPLYDPRQRTPPPQAVELRERAADAHAFLVGTPEYHGSVSGALKNVLDYLYHETHGKLFGLVVAAGIDEGSRTVSHLRDMVEFLGAWALPYAATATMTDFDESTGLTNARVRDRLQRLGRDVAVYGELLYDRYTRDAVPGGGPDLGFAPWHAR